MTHVTIPNRPLPKDNRDINAILANFDAITKVINGELGADNLENESLGLSKIEKGLFLELLVGGNHRKISFGEQNISFSPGSTRIAVTVAHGLGAEPLWFGGIAGNINTQIPSVSGVNVSMDFENHGQKACDKTNLYLWCQVDDGGTTNNFTYLRWAAIA